MRGSLLACIFAAFLLCLAASFSTAQAMRLSGNMFISMEPDSVQCIDVILPDDIGVSSRFKLNHTITDTSNWSSQFSEQLVSTDENNTAVIPICFFTFGRQIGECSEKFTISVYTPQLGLTKNWTGGVCVGEYRDVDIVSDAQSENAQDPREVLDNSVDFFDMSLSSDSKTLAPGEKTVISLNMESYANALFALSATFNGEDILTEGSGLAQTSAQDPRKTVNLQITAPAVPGDYFLTATATMQNCTLSSCTKAVTSKITVSETKEELKYGFTVSIFPANINIKDIGPVQLTATLRNGGDRARSIYVTIAVPEGATTSFEPDFFSLERNSEKKIDFTVTPSQITSFYEVSLHAKAADEEKTASAFISTNEMVTDTIRALDNITDMGNPSAISNATAAKNEWYDKYKDSSYGGDIAEYESLGEAFASAQQAGPGNQSATASASNTEDQNKTVNGDYGQSRPAAQAPLIDPTYIVLGAAVGIGIAIFIYFYRKSGQQDVDDKYYF